MHEGRKNISIVRNRGCRERESEVPMENIFNEMRSSMCAGGNSISSCKYLQNGSFYSGERVSEWKVALLFVDDIRGIQVRFSKLKPSTRDSSGVFIDSH
jgi:hypothetical protein